MDRSRLIDDHTVWFKHGEARMDKSIRAFVGTALASMLIVLAMPPFSSQALAAEDPIPLIDVVVEKIPRGSNVGRFRSDGNGYLRFRTLDAGTYHVTDKAGSKAVVRHRGGPDKWRLMGSMKSGKPVWTLVDESNPL